MTATIAQPRLAATLVVVRDDTPAGLQLFMQERANRMSFAAGALVFPGGSVDDGDYRIARDRKHVLDDRALDVAELALRVAAIRETFEESGVLLARKASADDLVDGQALNRRYHADGNKDFGALVEQEDLVLTVSALRRFAHWVTPTTMPKRFDTHFFIAPSPSDAAGTHDGREAVSSRWISPVEAIAAAEAGSIQLMFPTRLNLLRLSKYLSVDAVLREVGQMPITTVLPEGVLGEDGKRYLRIPKEAGYGGELFSVDLVPASERGG